MRQISLQLRVACSMPQTGCLQCLLLAELIVSLSSSSTRWLLEAPKKRHKTCFNRSERGRGWENGGKLWQCRAAALQAQLLSVAFETADSSHCCCCCLWLFRVFVVRLLERIVFCSFPSSLDFRYRYKRMRIVRFHLEPWQRGSGCGSVTPSPAQSPSLALLSPHVLRRQRPASLEDLEEICGQSQTPQQQQQQRLRRQRRLKCRYPQVVKRLSTLCSDVMAHHVSINRQLWRIIR